MDRKQKIRSFACLRLVGSRRFDILIHPLRNVRKAGTRPRSCIGCCRNWIVRLQSTRVDGQAMAARDSAGRQRQGTGTQPPGCRRSTELDKLLGNLQTAGTACPGLERLRHLLDTAVRVDDKFFLRAFIEDAVGIHRFFKRDNFNVHQFTQVGHAVPKDRHH